MQNFLSPFRTRPVWSDFDHLVQHFRDQSQTEGSVERSFSYAPRVDIEETPDAYLIAVDVPGLRSEDIKIDANNGQLIVSGERRREESKEEGAFRHFERSFGRFERRFQLPNKVEESKIEARLESGVLEVYVPKMEVAKSRSITVDSSKGGLFSKLAGRKNTKDIEEEKH